MNSVLFYAEITSGLVSEMADWQNWAVRLESDRQFWFTNTRRLVTAAFMLKDSAKC
jgi:hypothetical protein